MRLQQKSNRTRKLYSKMQGKTRLYRKRDLEKLSLDSREFRRSHGLPSLTEILSRKPKTVNFSGKYSYKPKGLNGRII